MAKNQNTIITRFSDACRDTMFKMLVEGIQAGLRGEREVILSRNFTLYDNWPALHAELTATFDLKLIEK